MFAAPGDEGRLGDGYFGGDAVKGPAEGAEFDETVISSGDREFVEEKEEKAWSRTAAITLPDLPDAAISWAFSSQFYRLAWMHPQSKPDRNYRAGLRVLVSELCFSSEW